MQGKNILEKQNTYKYTQLDKHEKLLKINSFKYEYLHKGVFGMEEEPTLLRLQKISCCYNCVMPTHVVMKSRKSPISFLSICSIPIL